MGFADLLSILSVAIVLVFVLLALSLIASVTVEAIAGYLGTRGRLLRSQILHMLDDPEEAGFARLLLRSPLLQALGSESRFPSYIPSEAFAQAVVAVMREHGLDEVSKLPPPLRALALGSGFGTEAERAAFRDHVATWYDQTMERLTGVYRRKSRFLLFIIGFVLAAALNVDMLSMSKQLWEQRAALDAAVEEIAEVRADIAARAEAAGGTAAEVLETDAKLRGKLAELFAQDAALGTLELPFGWALARIDCSVTEAAGESGDSCTITGFLGELVEQIDWTGASLLGWVLTALALLPGTNFWFDALGRLLALRAAGVKPEGLPDPRSGGTG